MVGCPSSDDGGAALHLKLLYAILAVEGLLEIVSRQLLPLVLDIWS